MDSEAILEAIQLKHKNMSRVDIQRLVDEEIAKAAGLLTPEGALHLIAENLLQTSKPRAEEPTFKSAADLPRMPDDFRFGEESMGSIEQLADNFDQPIEKVSSMVYNIMYENPELTEDLAIRETRKLFDRISKPVDADLESEEPVDEFSKIDKEIRNADVDPGLLNWSNDHKIASPRKFLGADWNPIEDILKKYGYTWISAGRQSHWTK